MPHRPTIVLIGPRAAGKSTIGRLLASTLACPFIDLDDRVRARFDGASVAEIWRRHGESAFRAAESSTLETLLASAGATEPLPDAHSGSAAVLALGGGTPMIERAERALCDARARGAARIALLLAPVEVLAARLHDSASDRPSLTGEAPQREVAHVLETRLPTYVRLADARFDTSRGDPREVAAALATWVRAVR